MQTDLLAIRCNGFIRLPLPSARPGRKPWHLVNRQRAVSIARSKLGHAADCLSHQPTLADEGGHRWRAKWSDHTAQQLREQACASFRPERHVRQREHSACNGPPLKLVGLKQGGRIAYAGGEGQFPAEIERVLNTGVHSLTGCGGECVGCVSDQEKPPRTETG